MRHLLLAFAFSFLFFNQHSFAQQNDFKVKPVLLKSGTLVSGSEWVKPIPDEWVNGRFYRLVQFSRIPDHLEQKELARQDIRILDYIPKNTFLISLGSVADLKILEDHGAIFAIPLTPRGKLTSNVAENNLPDWSWDGDWVKLVVHPYSDQPFESLTNDLQAFGIQIINEDPQNKRWEVKVPPADIRKVALIPFVSYVQEAEEPGEPENYKARTNHRSNAINTLYNGGRKYDGNGVVVGHGDDGALADHIDYTGRIDTSFAGPSNGNHGDHVAGTVMGAGNLDPKGEGMAKGAHLVYYSYPANLNNIDTHYGQFNIRITQSSYSNGCNAGYTSYTRQMDEDIRQHDALMHVFSAGNAGTSNCGYGAGSGWGNVTGGHKIAKNVIAVANILDNNTLATSSSRGPASDGRIKPDVAAVGTNVYSTIEPNTYANFTGTSMACPGVSGTMAQLYQAYRDNHSGNDPEGGLMKAILLNTTDDLLNPGPDFKVGYGRINALRAVKAIENNTFIVDSVTQSASKNHVISVPSGASELRVMVFWVDPQASTIASRALVNDLNMTVQAPNSTTYLPWVLDPTPNAANLNANAVRAVDSLNNMEQVTLANPAAGNYTVNVTGTTVPTGPQKYYVVYVIEDDGIEVTHPIGGESFISGTQNTIRWNAPGGTGNFTVEYSTNGGSTWTTISSSVPGTNRLLNWSAPNLTTGQALVRVSQGSSSDQSDAHFSIMEQPMNLAISWACTDSFRLRWDPVSNATGYIIHQLGQKYMDSVDFTVDTGYVFTNQDPTVDHWVSVTAIGANGAHSTRAIAIQKLAGNYNCRYPYDLAITDILAPAPGVHASCAMGSNPKVVIKVRNPGLNDIYGHSIGYRLNNGTPVTLSPGDTISVFGTKEYSFTNSLNLNNGTTYTLTTWVSYSNDGNYLNDTLVSNFKVEAGSSVNLPFFESFDNWTSCSTGTNCATNCTPGSGWKQHDNGVFDEMDWRVNAGGTPSSGTGPTSGNGGSGKYLYTESSGTCTDQVVIINTPCVDLGTASSPELVYYIHMRGAAMGSLHTDVVSNGQLYADVAPVLSGSQGNNWLKRTVNLSAFAGQTILVRFRAVTGNDFTSDIAIDDISIVDASVTPPTASFTAPVAGLCPGDTVTFTSTSTGTITGYSWDFGPNATPATANTMGPHKVVYSQGGNIVTKLTTYNTGGSDVSNQVLNLSFTPVSAFSYSFTPPATYNFQNNSSGNPSTYHWDFGDGDTSAQASPSHTYTSSGQFTVMLVSTNACGNDTLSLVLNSYVSIEEMDPFQEARVFPVPTQGDLFLTGLSEFVRSLDYVVHDMSGKELLKGSIESSGGEVSIPHVGRLAAGTYLLNVRSGNRNSVFRFVVE